MNGDLDRLAERAGIEPTFTDYFGRQCEVTAQTKGALLTAMHAGDEPEPDVPPVVVTRAGTPPPELGGATAAELELEDGACWNGALADAPLGYHRLYVRGAGGTHVVPYIVVPPSCYVPETVEAEPIWAASTQLYALRSRGNWGIGDFSDLAHAARVVGNAGGAAIGLNPLHDLHPSNPHACSPYAPSSRLFLNALYIDVMRVPELEDSQRARILARAPGFQTQVHTARESSLVDYPLVARLKHEILELLFAAFNVHHLERPGDARAARWRRFVREGGVALERLARYEALAEAFAAHDPPRYGWQQWPAQYRSPTDPAVERFARERRKRVEFYLYLQWLADEQLAAASDAARRAGVGLFRDLAVGVEVNGADAWADQTTILEGVSLGAPPDHLNAQGQNWGLPPLAPHALRRAGYAPFAALLRANMRYATVLRIDHVMALRRAFWIPRGQSALDGAYVRSPFEDMLGVLALESMRHRCTIVGEDLGTVPEGFRERMAAARALSSRLVYFERRFGDARFAPPSSYPVLAASSVGSHDLPPLAGWWTGDDIELRARAGLFPDDGAAQQARDERRYARFVLVDALAEAGCVDEPAAARLRADAERGGTLEPFAPLRDGVYRFLGRTPSLLKIVSFEDALGEIDAVNVPGTIDQHPNWRRKHRRSLEELEADGTFSEIGRLLKGVAAQ